MYLIHLISLAIGVASTRLVEADPDNRRELPESSPYFAFGRDEAENMGWKAGSYSCSWQEVCTLNEIETAPQRGQGAISTREQDTSSQAQNTLREIIVACKKCKKTCANTFPDIVEIQACKDRCRAEHGKHACSLTSTLGQQTTTGTHETPGKTTTNTAPHNVGTNGVANRGNDGTCSLPTRDGPFTLTDCNDWQTIVAVDGSADKRFGDNVDIEGDWVCSSASGDDKGTGAMYMFKKQASGYWASHQKIRPIAGQPGDEFTFCSLSGDTMAVGAKLTNNHGVDSGAAYVYRFNPGKDKWVLETRIVPSDGATLDYFGNNLAVHSKSGKLLVGARLHDPDGKVDAGAVYAYYRQNNQWGGEEKITPDERGAGRGRLGDEFGARIMFDNEGDSAIITAHRRDVYGQDSGAAYVFKYERGRGWKQDQILTPNDGIPNAQCECRCMISIFCYRPICDTRCCIYACTCKGYIYVQLYNSHKYCSNPTPYTRPAKLMCM